MNLVKIFVCIFNVVVGWIGMFYWYQVLLMGVGCDCLGFVCGFWCEFYGEELEELGFYVFDWVECGGIEWLVEVVLCYFGFLIDWVEMQLGDVFFFCFRFGVVVKYFGILVGEGCFIYVYEQVGVVFLLFVFFWVWCIVVVYCFLDM